MAYKVSDDAFHAALVLLSVRLRLSAKATASMK